LRFATIAPHSSGNRSRMPPEPLYPILEAISFIDGGLFPARYPRRVASACRRLDLGYNWPPMRPSATACGFLAGSAGGSVLGSWPVASRIIWNALWLGSRGRGSRGRFFDRTQTLWSREAELCRQIAVRRRESGLRPRATAGISIGARPRLPPVRPPRA
jgi:hypothetical protein